MRTWLFTTICLHLVFTCGTTIADNQETCNISSAHIADDSPGSIRFWGSETAALYTKEIDESYKEVLRINYVSDTSTGFPLGFLRASQPPFGWNDTFWTRDGGTFMRELTMWGYLEHACLTAKCLINLVQLNDEGFYAFPEYLKANEPRAGTEMDGTTSIIIGMVLLWERLPQDHPCKETLYNFLHQQASPVRYILKQLDNAPLIEGSGEFGGGCGIPGLHYNVVQNNLAVLALLAAANMESAAGDADMAKLYRQGAEKLSKNMEKYLVNEDGTWIWCIDPKTLKPDPAIVDHIINKGFGGINGPGCMYTDVLGFYAKPSALVTIEHSRKTFEKLYNKPLRKQQFDKYGIWTQFDEYGAGLVTSPSYGQCYALQAMLFFDKLDMADKAIEFLANATYNPPKEYKLDRSSNYYFYERMYSPDAAGKISLEQGCGALNLINVTESLKIARLILGVDDTSPEEVMIIPRIPPSWKGVEATNWPIRTNTGIVRADIHFAREDGNYKFTLKLKPGQIIPKLTIRMPSASGNSWHKKNNASDVNISSTISN